jgi:hypothetical protein
MDSALIVWGTSQLRISSYISLLTFCLDPERLVDACVEGNVEVIAESLAAYPHLISSVVNIFLVSCDFS